MEHSQSFLMLVRQASLGDQDSTQKLLQATSIKLFSYILQLTLDYSLAKELTKEVQNEIAQSLWRLKKPQHFWPRIYAQTLEMSSVGIAYTGDKTNNSRQLRIEAEKGASSDRIDVFLQYVRIANVMGENLVVDR